MNKNEKRGRTTANSSFPKKIVGKSYSTPKKAAKVNDETVVSLVADSLTKRVKPSFHDDQRFEPEGCYEALGYALRQLTVSTADSPETLNTLFKSLLDDYQGEPEQLGMLKQLRAELVRRKSGQAGQASPEPEPVKLFTMADARQVLGETVYTWRPYLMQGGLTAIAGDVGSGKTAFTMDLHRRQWHRLTWPDGKEIAGGGRPIVWLMADQRLSQLADLMQVMGLPDESIVLASERESVTSPLLLDDPASLDRIAYIVREAAPWAIVIDTFTSAMGSREHNKPEVMNGITAFLHDVAIANRIPVILLTHTNAEGGIYGKALGRKCEHQLSIVLSDRRDIKSPRNIHPKRSRYLDEAESLGVNYSPESWEYREAWPEVEDKTRADGTVKKTPRDNVKEEALLMADLAGEKGFEQHELVKALMDNLPEGSSHSTVRSKVNRAVSDLVDESKLIRKGDVFWMPKYTQD